MSIVFDRITCIVLLLVTCLAVGCDERTPSVARLPITKDAQTLADGNSEFAFDLYHQLAKQSDGNLFFSPYSISTALSMTYAGARGTTETEMANVLHFSLAQPQQHLAAQVLISNFSGSGRDYQLSVANRIWGRNDVEFVPPFLDITREQYYAELARLDFAAQTEASRKEINQWVEDNTNRKIVDLVKPGGIIPQTVIVLTNAVYFKGNWAQQFDKQDTHDDDFHLSATDTIKVPLMYQSDDLPFVENDTIKMIELPYEGDDLSMLVLLPKEGKNLSDITPSLTLANLQKWRASLAEKEVDVWLPRFKVTSEFELSETLKAMGMPTAFEAADFTGMSSAGAAISQVLHKAFVEVNEEGTEAAAATAVILAESASLAPSFRADRPFVFVIQDKATGSILFMSRIVNPTG
jgi:serpin B